MEDKLVTLAILTYTKAQILKNVLENEGIETYILYRSHWNKDVETLHILPHWNWEGHEGEVVPVFVYTNYPSAELFINGKSQGKRTKDLSVTIDNSADSVSTANLKRQQRYRLMWMNTKYEPGTVFRITGVDSWFEYLHTLAGKLGSFHSTN